MRNRLSDLAPFPLSMDDVSATLCIHVHLMSTDDGSRACKVHVLVLKGPLEETLKGLTSPQSRPSCISRNMIIMLPLITKPPQGATEASTSSAATHQYYCLVFGGRYWLSRGPYAPGTQPHPNRRLSYAKPCDPRESCWCQSRHRGIGTIPKGRREGGVEAGPHLPQLSPQAPCAMLISDQCGVRSRLRGVAQIIGIWARAALHRDGD